MQEEEKTEQMKSDGGVDGVVSEHRGSRVKPQSARRFRTEQSVSETSVRKRSDALTDWMTNSRNFRANQVRRGGAAGNRCDRR